MPVAVLSRARHPECRAARVRGDARAILATLGQGEAELTVALVDDGEMRNLNRRYRGKDTPTDVLAFAMREGMRAPDDESLLGDIAISLDTAARQARGRRVPLEAEIRTLLIHGILHLLGYDHEISAAEKRRMEAKEREVSLVLRER